MRLLFVIDTRDGQFGGVEGITFSLAEALSRRGHQVHVACIGRPIPLDHLEIGTVSTSVIASAALELVESASWSALIGSLKPDAVILAKGWFDRRNEALDECLRDAGIPLLLWENHPPPKLARTRLRRAVRLLRQPVHSLRAYRARRMHWNSAVRILCLSEAVRKPLIDGFGLPREKADQIYPGTDLRRFFVDDSLRRRMRDAWQLPADAFVIGSIGRLVPHKRNDLLLESFALLKAQDTQNTLRCVIGGAGPERERLEALASQLGVQSSVYFAGWIDDSCAAWNAIDIFALPSEDEGLAMVLIEAIACGCIPLAANAGGMPEILRGVKPDLLVLDYSAKAWAAKIGHVRDLSADARTALVHQLTQSMAARFDGQTQWNRIADWVEQYANQ